MSLPLLIPNAPLLETLKETADVLDPRMVKAKRRAEWPRECTRPRASTGVICRHERCHAKATRPP
jgi:hypothetical protein